MQLTEPYRAFYIQFILHASAAARQDNDNEKTCTI